MSECPQRPASDSRVSASGARESHFLAILSRMKYIERWALMRSSRSENLSEHALDVALIAHVLASLGNARHGRHLDADRAAVLGLFHDASEIITGDMPTPVKYHDASINEAYKAVEAGAEARLLATLPEDLRGVYGTYFFAGDGHGGSGAAADGDEAYLRRLVKAADKISALIKCVDERRSGNAEFASAEDTCRAAVEAAAAELPEVADFAEEFLPSFGSTLDQLLG